MRNTAPWTLSPEEAAQQLQTDLERGLSESEAAARLAKHGPNRIQQQAARSPLRLLLSQFADLMIGLLAAAAVVSALIGEWTDSILIAVIVVANAVIGFVQEWRAERAVEALKKLSEPTAKARRDGHLRELSVAEVVPGDVVEVAAGDFVPADCRLVQAANLETEESALTGESLPVEKTTDAQPAETALPDRRGMLFAGTAAVRGHARAVVAATGMETELGKIATLLESAEAGQTPLQRRLAQLSKRLAIVVLIACLVIFAAGVLREPRDEWDTVLLSHMLLTAVSLAVAAIPEGLPAVITIALALGSQRMASRKAIIRRLAAVETLGSVNVICSDKTGTLTQNRMAAEDLVPVSDGDEGLRELLTAAVLCNDAELSADGKPVGTATEAALLSAGLDHGLDVRRLRGERRRLAEVPFSSDRKRMTTLHESRDGQRVLYIKGAAERILARTDGGDVDAAAWQQRADDLAGRGRRVLALAIRDWDGDALPDNPEDAEKSLQLLGLVGIVDPVRPEAGDAIAECRSAGIRPVMITGDHVGTARSIAEDLQLASPDDEALTGTELERLSDEELARRAPRIAVYARVSPEHKLRIVRAHQSHGSVVAMTGDGVNDAPALKQADIGVAMGVTGTDVAKEAGAMVLADDNFATIVAAVEEGRVVYDNIRKFVAYLLTTNTGEVLVLFVTILLGLPLPLLPVHLLWINLVTDGLPALALGFEPAEPDVMRRRPRKREESLFADGLAWGIVLLGVLMAASCVGLFWWYVRGGDVSDAAAQAHSLAYAQTLVFLTLSMFQLFHVLAIRSASVSFFRQGPWSNWRLTIAVLLGTGLQIAVTYVPPLQRFFHTVPLSALDLAIGVAVASSVFWVLEGWKLVRPRFMAAGR